MATRSFSDAAAERIDRIAACVSKLDEIASEFASLRHIPGLAYGVIADGRLIHGGGVGFADIDAQISVDERVLFRIASMTKSFTAMAILQLRDAGRLGLDDPVARHVPELASLVYPTSDSPRLTLRHLLTMNAGWPEDNPWGDRQVSLEDTDFAALLASGVTFAETPNLQYEYSNLAYMILGRVVSQVAGRPFQEYAIHHILHPLGMMDTCWNADEANQPVARGYRRYKTNYVEDELAWAVSAGDAAAFGGLYSSVRDLAKWVAFFLSAWPPRDGDEHPVLRRSSLREMQRCANPALPVWTGRKVGAPIHLEAGGYGYGLFATHTTELGQMVGHSGGLPGFGSHMIWLPEYDIGVVTLGNVTYAPAVPVAGQMLRSIVTAADLSARTVHPANHLLDAQIHVTRLIAEWSDELADEVTAINFFLDTPRAQWHAEIAQLHERHGALHLAGDLKVKNPLRGWWKMRGERGWCIIWITLTPTIQPRIQHLSIESVLPPDERMQAVLEAVLAAAAAPSKRRVASLVDPAIDRDAMLTHLRIVKLLYGVCTLDAIVGGNGTDRVVARLTSEQGALEVEIVLDSRSGKVSLAEFRSPPSLS